MIALLALTLSSASAIPPERAAYRQAAALCDHGDWRNAESFLRAALTRFEGIESDDLWEMRLLLGDTLTARTKYQAAADVLAPTPPRRLAHSSIAIRRLLAQAVLAYRFNDLPKANSLLATSEALARSYQPSLLADVLGRRAVLETARKDFEAAERDARRSITLARKSHNRIFEINALGTLARLRTFQRRYDEAVAYNRRALTLASEAGARSKIEKVSGNLGWTLLLLGDFDAAADYLSRALSIAESIGAEYDIVPWLQNLGNIALHNHDYAGALNYYQRGVVVARRIGHRDLGDFVANTAVALLETGNTAAARKANEEARSLMAADPDPEQLLRLLLIEARIDAKAGLLDSAISKAQRVSRSKLKSQRWEAEARLARFSVDEGNAVAADQHFRRALETASEAREDVKTEELRLPFGALVREVNEEYVDFLLRAGRVEEGLDAAESSRAQTLNEALGEGEVRHRYDPKRVAVDRSAIILSYWLGARHSYVWTINAASIEWEQLPQASAIEEAVDACSRDIQLLRGRVASQSHAAKLYSMLIPRALARLSLPPGARVIVVPDGRLHGFNLETLVNPATHRYWIEDVTIETASSIELLESARSSPTASSMLLVGDPPSPDREFPRLANAADEIARIRKHFATNTVLEGPRATPRAYENADPGRYGFIHFVAHGTATRQRPLDSAVVLAREGDSYKLYARDILKHPLRARLVTISSCHGAGLRAYTGEGLVGLAWAFLHAGARQVIAALWEVNDRATPQLMDDFYTGIRASQDTATALRNAKLRLIQRGGVNGYPKYWAPFVLYSGS